jgi:CO/xanthine dehydrogenase Mo-binding subunit
VTARGVTTRGVTTRGVTTRVVTTRGVTTRGGPLPTPAEAPSVDFVRVAPTNSTVGGVGDRVRGGVGDRVRGGVGDRVRGGVGDRVRGGVGERVRGGIGDRVPRSDGRAKVTGQFAYASDLRAERMLVGVTVRSPHASARLGRIDVAAARAVPGVRAVLTHADVPGDKCVGPGHHKDQPVLAFDRVRCHGEPVAVVAAEDLATARRAAALVEVDYEPLPVVSDAEAALAPGAQRLHPHGNELRTVRIRHGDPATTGPVTVHGSYEVGMQDQAFLGPEAGLARPLDDGGVELEVATQWLHLDREQVAAALGLPEGRVQLILGGVGGAFGGREDLSIHVHACMLALATRRPVKMVYGRDESFLGHVHRHPARLDYEHVADEEGRLVCVRARLLFDGGAYASSSPAVIANAATQACGPYAVPNAQIDATVAYTNNPPCGAMRGFGAPQVAIAYEAQMDRLADRLGLDPVEVRILNALTTGAEMPTGQLVPGPVDAEALLTGVREIALPAPPGSEERGWPGGAFGATEGEGVRRGVGYAFGFKNVGFSEGFDDYTVARVRLSAPNGLPRAEVVCAAAEVGQGVVGVAEQVVRTELGVEDVRVLAADTRAGSAGAASASRLTWMVAGAVGAACRAVRERLGSEVAARPVELAELLGDGELEEEATYRHRPTSRMDPATGRGEVHAGFAFVAHRAVVDVDVELGIARVAQLACAQDVGRAINPLALEGQLEGAGLQGMGLALMEEMAVDQGLVTNRSLGEYRIPTIADAPEMPSLVLERGNPDAPYGVTGVGELAAITSTPAVLAALRAATGRPLTRVPARPEDLAAVEGWDP